MAGGYKLQRYFFVDAKDDGTSTLYLSWEFNDRGQFWYKYDVPHGPADAIYKFKDHVYTEYKFRTNPGVAKSKLTGEEWYSLDGIKFQLKTAGLSREHYPTLVEGKLHGMSMPKRGGDTFGSDVFIMDSEDFKHLGIWYRYYSISGVEPNHAFAHIGNKCDHGSGKFKGYKFVPRGDLTLAEIDALSHNHWSNMFVGYDMIVTSRRDDLSKVSYKCVSKFNVKFNVKCWLDVGAAIKRKINVEFVLFGWHTC